MKSNGINRREFHILTEFSTEDATLASHVKLCSIHEHTINVYVSIVLKFFMVNSKERWNLLMLCFQFLCKQINSFNLGRYI
jgi:hypothetical protein